MKTISAFLMSLLAAALVACGGGGGGSGSTSPPAAMVPPPAPPPPVVSTNTFNVLAGYQQLNAQGATVRLNISGSCTGTFLLVAGAASTVATFEGKPALSAAEAVSESFSNCTPASSITTTTRYFDSSYMPVGFSVQGSSYGVYTSTPSIPAAAKVGDKAAFGNVDIYTDASKTTKSGYAQLSYVIEAESASSAIANLIELQFDAKNVLIVTVNNRYRVKADNSLALLSIDVQYANGSTVHLIFS